MVKTSRNIAQANQKKAYFLIIGILIVIVIVLALTLALRERPNSVTTNKSTRGCSLVGSGQSVPTAAPSVTWPKYNGESLPSSATDGPGKVDGAVATCYAHTPVGALIALAQIDLRMSVTSDASVAAAILNAQAEPGPGRSEDLGIMHSGTSGSDGVASYQVAGFRFVSYTPQTAVVSFAMRQANGGYETATYVADWQNGDWKARLNNDGSIATPFAALDSLNGYVVWGAGL